MWNPKTMIRNPRSGIRNPNPFWNIPYDIGRICFNMRKCVQNTNECNTTPTCLCAIIVLVCSALRDFFLHSYMRVSMSNYKSCHYETFVYYETQRINKNMQFYLLTSTQKLYFIVFTVTVFLESVHTPNPFCCAATNNIIWVLPRYFCGTNSTFCINWFKASFTWYLERKNAWQSLCFEEWKRVGTDL